MTSSANSQSVPEIVSHEAREHARVQDAKSQIASKEEQVMRAYEKTLKDEETKERASATAELQAFGAEEIPAMLEKGEAARTKAVAAVDEHARKELPNVTKILVEKAVSGSLLF